ncbi:MAG: hypothetical protein WB608_03195 [Terracidiphilus sp.]
MLRIRVLFITLFLMILCFPGLSQGQQSWSGILSPARADANWPNVGASIPSGTLPNCAQQPSSNTPAAVSAAFTADAGGSSYCQINIPAGTYNISGTFVLQYSGKANVVLNGAGPNSTFFVWNGSGSMNCNGLNSTNVCVWNGDSATNAGSGHWPNTATMSGTMTQGTTTLNLSNFTNLKVGSEIEIAQQDASSDNGNAWFCGSSGFTGSCSQQGGAQAPTINGVNATETQMVTVTSCGTSTFGASCSSGTVNITPGIKATNWSTSNSPTAAWSNTMPIYNVGVQNMSFDVSGTTARIFTECHDCSNVWFHNLRQINGTVTGQASTNHMIIWQSNHVTVDSSYFYGSNPQMEGYGIDWDAATSDSLAYNNIGQHVATSYITETASGNVYAYNYAVDNYFGSGWQQCDELHHAGGDYFTLWEGNVGICGGGDDIHGTHFANTWYRTYLSGFDPATETGAKYDNTSAFQDMSYARYDNLVANVLGTQGYHNTYQNVGVGGNPSSCPSFNQTSIYRLGFGNQNEIPWSPACIGSPYTIDNDNLVNGSIMRWANYDVVNGSVQENSSETAASAPTYAGLGSPATTFPPSLYLTSQPSWWVFPSGTTSPWPGIGPDVTGGNISGTAGHAWLNPAANCYLNVMKGSTNGSSGPLSFDPNSCYPAGAVSSSSGPSAPTNLTGTVVQ